MNIPRPRITLLNGSLGGKTGNTGAILETLLSELRAKSEVREIHLRDGFDPSEIAETLNTSDAFVFATGTYWDSWGSPLQRFLEEATEFEASDTWLGKPAAVLVTMHSVGGKEVLSRLQGVLSTLGCQIPPMSGMTYSLANHLALKCPDSSGFHADLWQLQDLKIIAHNLLEALGEGRNWKTWPVDSEDARRRWFSN